MAGLDFLWLASMAIMTPVAATQEQALLNQIADTLDVTSFPSSIGPRAEAGKRRYADYGFTIRTQLPDGLELKDQGGWAIHLRLLAYGRTSGASWARLCKHEEAREGGSYFAGAPSISSSAATSG